mgnify:CR=1 FL=1
MENLCGRVHFPILIFRDFSCIYPDLDIYTRNQKKLEYYYQSSAEKKNCLQYLLLLNLRSTKVEWKLFTKTVYKNCLHSTF